MFADGNDHEAECWGQRAAHWTASTSSTLTNASLAQRKGLHVECCCEKGWDIFDDDLPCDVESTKCAAFDEVSWTVSFPGETEKTSLFMGGRKKSRSIISRAPRNRSWPMLVKKPARSWLIRTRLASTGADRKMSKKAYTSPEAKWFGQATGMRWKIIRTRILSIGRKGESTNEMIGRPLWRAFFLLARM